MTSKKPINRVCSDITEAQTYIKTYKLGLSKISKVNGRTRVNSLAEWTNEDLEILKKYYPDGGYKKCQENGLNKTMYAITSQAALMGIKRNYEIKEDEIKNVKSQSISKKSTNAINPNAEAIKNGSIIPSGWTKKYIDILVNYYPIGGTSLCQEKGLNKKNSTIRMMAKSLGIVLEKNKPWTKEEDALLEATFKKHNTKESCYEVFTDRTKTAINARLKELDLVLKKRWTKKEEQILIENFPKGGAKLVIEKGVDRSVREIGAKASNLGIKIENKRKSWSEEEEEILKKYYPVEGMEVLNRLEDVSELCLRNKVRHMGLASPTNRWDDSELEILKKYYPIEGGRVAKRLPGKTLPSIYYKASLLNLKTTK